MWCVVNWPLLLGSWKDRYCDSVTIISLNKKLTNKVKKHQGISTMTVDTHIHQTTNMMYWLHGSSRTLRFAASIVLITFNMLILSPVVHAVQDNPIQPTESTNPEADLSTAFEQIINQLDALKQARQDDQDTTAILAKLQELADKVAGLDVAVMDNFNKLEEELKTKQLPPVILQRHTDMVTHYKVQRDAWLEQLESETGTGFFVGLIRTAKDWMGVAPVTEKVISPLNPKDPKQFKRKQQPFDPNEVSDRSLKPNPTNMPKVNKDEFTQAGLHSTPYTKLAALGDFTFDNLAGASDPVYLAASDEITLSQAIKDKAAELLFDPIKIHHFVRNNIEWVPSWGAIQNADLTLSAQRGNAMDISSLTIALLRASQIPSRYVHGTIDVPRDRFLNWAGGFTDINAAMTFAASAGIPVTPVIGNGQVSKVRIEHVWVEAAVDYFPSRGAKNRDADAWVQFDPSYKQYEFLEGVDAVAVSGVDPEQLTQSFLNSGTINESEGWVTGFDATILTEAQTQTQQMLQSHIMTNIPSPLVQDIIGSRKTIIDEYPVLPSSLPNRIVVEGVLYDKLPSKLQQTIGWAFERDVLGEVVDAVIFPMALVNNEKIILSFKSATDDDEAVLQSFLPTGEVTDISQLPNSISSHLINVVPELKVNGMVVKTGNPMRLGEELNLITLVKFAHQPQSARDYQVIAGSLLILNSISQSVSPEKLMMLRKKLEVSRQILETNNVSQFDTLTGENTFGDIFQVGSLAYYGQMLTLTRISGVQNQSNFHLAAGIGTVGYEPAVNYFFGFPRSISHGGVAFDIPYIQVSAHVNSDQEKLRQFNLQVGGITSILEHTIIEQMFNSDPANPPDAISAAKALQKAAAGGQRIYQITQSNMSSALPNIHHDIDTMNEIIASVNTGKLVMTHTDAVSIPGWTGAGYVIIDPETNVGAWKISGGTNGGFLGFVLGLLFVIAIFFISTPILLAIAIGGIIAASLILTFTLSPLEAANFAVARFLTILLTFILFSIIFAASIFIGISVVIAAIILAALAALIAIVRLILSLDTRWLRNEKNIQYALQKRSCFIT